MFCLRTVYSFLQYMKICKTASMNDKNYSSHVQDQTVALIFSHCVCITCSAYCLSKIDTFTPKYFKIPEGLKEIWTGHTMWMTDWLAVWRGRWAGRQMAIQKILAKKKNMIAGVILKFEKLTLCNPQQMVGWYNWQGTYCRLSQSWDLTDWSLNQAWPVFQLESCYKDCLVLHYFDNTSVLEFQLVWLTMFLGITSMNSFSASNWPHLHYNMARQKHTCLHCGNQQSVFQYCGINYQY